MGISDRDYARQPAARFSIGGGGLRRSGPRGWSVNTWLIVGCIAVFMVNSLLPQTFIPRGSPIPVPGLSADVEFAASSLRLGSLPEDRRFRTGQTTAVPVIHTTSDGEDVVVGAQPVQVQGYPFVWGYFSTEKAIVSFDATWGLVGFEFWRFITFQFLHANLSHILFNMIALFFFGSIVEQFLGGKRYLAFYLLCGVSGACMYLLLNGGGLLVAKFTGVQSVPFLLFENKDMPLVGASAGVFGVIMAAAYLMPQTTVLVFFVIPMKLKTLAYGLVVLALLAVFFKWEGSNAGGEAAHIGGAIAGFYFVRRPHQLHGFFDLLGRFDPTSRTNKARKAGTIRAKARGGASPMQDTAEIDRILDKIHRKGLQSLSAKEKKRLREASRG